MCRLLGIRANKPVDLNFSMTRFRPLGAEHSDGWGIGWYERGEVRLHKEHLPAVKSNTYEKHAVGAISEAFVCHVRKATHGAVSHENSHPFRRGSWLFAHNGTLDRDLIVSLLGDAARELEGDTDSEAFFVWLLKCIEEEQGDVAAGLKRAVAPIDADHYKGINFLMSDGERFFAYRDCTCRHEYYTLYYVDRHPGNWLPAAARSHETEAFVTSLANHNERAIVVCSEMLTGELEPWQLLGTGELLTVESDLSMSKTVIRPASRC